MARRASFLATLALLVLPAAADPIEVLVVTGANNHDWEFTTEKIVGFLGATGKFRVEVTRDPAKTFADAEALGRYQVLFLNYNGPRWEEPAESNFLAAVRAGAGVVVLHAANNAFPGWAEYEKLVGDCWREGTGHGRFHSFDVRIVVGDHPITAGLEDFRAHPDELYHALVHTPGIETTVLAVAHSAEETGGSGKDEPMAMVLSYGKGRVFHTPLGHVWPGVPETRVSIEDPALQRLLVRATEWVATGEVTESAAAAPNALSESEAKEGWKLLFDGRSTAEWRGFRQEGFPGSGWVAEDGALHHVGGAGGGDIITRETFQDFELALEWRVAPGANSGIMYLVTEEGGATWATGPEMQVLDDERHPDGGNRLSSAGSLYGLIAAPAGVVRPAGEYNRIRIRVERRHVEHWMNDVKVVEYDLDGDEFRGLVDRSKFRDMEGYAKATRGHIALQDHGDDVWYRNLKIRTLAPE